MSEVVQCVSGTSMHGLACAVDDIWGPDVRKRGLALLDEESRLQIEMATAQLWVPMGILAKSVDAWAEAAGVSAEELTTRGTQHSTRKAFATIWRLFLRATTDEALITRTPILYSKVRNVGTLEASLRNPRLARLVLTGWRNGTDRQLLSLAVAFETILDITGRHHPRCTFRRTSDGGLFDIAWGDPSVPPRKWLETERRLFGS